MGCDGIWETMSEQEIIEFVDKRIPDRKIAPKDLEPIVESLLDNLIAPDTSSNHLFNIYLFLQLELAATT